jgi:hypothetical protein
MKVVKGNGEFIPGDPQPSDDAEYIGRIGRNISDGSLRDCGMFREQLLQFGDGEQKWFRGWQLDIITEEDALAHAAESGKK